LKRGAKRVKKGVGDNVLSRLREKEGDPNTEAQRRCLGEVRA
jgi:hypothetical protein